MDDGAELQRYMQTGRKKVQKSLERELANLLYLEQLAVIHIYSLRLHALSANRAQNTQMREGACTQYM